MATSSTSQHAAAAAAHAGGGFFPPSLPSPTPSTASSRAAAGLPHPRSKPLVPGSRKEDYAREYVYRRLLHVSRRYVKKHSIPDPHDVVSAYESFDEVCKDLEEVVDVLWFSGTPTLQVPYLLNVTLAVTEYIHAFPPSPRPTFSLLQKLDHCFSSLLRGKDVRTEERLPGFENGMGKGLTRTDMVRLRSLVDETRSLVAIKMSGEADVDTSLFPEDSDTAAPTMMTSTPPATTSARKRKAGERSEDTESEDEPLYSDRSSLTPKRQKSLSPMNTDSPAALNIESPTVKLEAGGASPAINGHVQTSIEAAGGSDGQFHWALDDSDGSDDEDSTENAMAVDMSSRPPQQPTPTSVTSNSNDQSQVAGHDTNDYSVEDDEDEELHMSVAKVYEKTIIELGRTLGETLIDE